VPHWKHRKKYIATFYSKENWQIFGLMQKVAVAEHDAFWISCRAGSVDDGRNIVARAFCGFILKEFRLFSWSACPSFMMSEKNRTLKPALRASSAADCGDCGGGSKRMTVFRCA
jgi:hypothetical protein